MQRNLAIGHGARCLGALALALAIAPCVAAPAAGAQSAAGAATGELWTLAQTSWAQNLYGVALAGSKRGWAVGDGGTIVHTGDGGATWQPQQAPVAQDLAGVVFAGRLAGWAVGASGTILHTADGGAHWLAQAGHTAQDLQAVACVGPLQAWAVGGQGTILHTADGGVTWQPQHAGAPAGTLWAVAFAGVRYGWATGDGGTLLHTADGGATWQTQASGTTVGLLGLATADAGHAWAVGWDGTLLYTADGGARWLARSIHTDRTLEAIAQLGQKALQVVGAGDLDARTADGTHWTAQRLDSAGGLTGVAFADALHGWAIGRGSLLLATADGGRSWQTRPTGSSDLLAAITFASPLAGWAVGYSGCTNHQAKPQACTGTILHTADGGATWRAQLARTPDGQGLFAVSFPDAQDGWAVGWDGTILHTTDGGATWQLQSAQLYAYDDVAQARFFDAQHGWLLAAYLGGNGLFQTIDGGVTWAPVSVGDYGLSNTMAWPDATHGWVVGRPSQDTGHVTDNNDVLGTTDGGRTWRRQLRSAADTLGPLLFTDDEHGWVLQATVDQTYTLLRTTDGGATWKAIATNLPGPYTAMAAPDAYHLVLVGGTSASTVLLLTRQGGVTTPAGSPAATQTGTPVPTVGAVQPYLAYHRDGQHWRGAAVIPAS